MMTGGDQCICGSEYLINNQDNDHVPEEVVKLQEWALTKTMSTTAAVIADNLQFNSMASPNLLNTTTVNDDDNPSDDQIATKLKLTLTEDEQVISQVAACKETTPEREECVQVPSLENINEQTTTTNCDYKIDANNKMCQTPWENPQRHSLIVLNLRRRLAEQEDANKRLRLEKDAQLKEVTKTLLILEAQLRREQHQIRQILEDKEKKIAEQEKNIKALLTLNRKLAASRHRTIDKKYTTFDLPADKKHVSKTPKRQQRKISWHNEVHVITDYDLHWTAINNSVKTLTRSEEANNNVKEDQRVGNTNKSCMKELQLTNGDPNLDDDDDDDNRRTETEYKFNAIAEVREADLCLDINEACDALNFALQESEGDCLHSTDLVASTTQPNRDDDVCSSDSELTLCANSPIQKAFNNSCLLQANLSTTVKKDANPPPSLGIYNRVMSNHRSVTKPKDVKYKKISRVKSRSLEELRGRLKQHHRSQPLGFLDGPVPLESSEEL